MLERTRLYARRDTSANSSDMVDWSGFAHRQALLLNIATLKAPKCLSRKELVW